MKLVNIFILVCLLTLELKYNLLCNVGNAILKNIIINYVLPIIFPVYDFIFKTFLCIIQLNV